MKVTTTKILCLLCAVLLLGTLSLAGCQKQEPAPQPTHNHEEPIAMGIEYTEEENGTLSLTIKDCEGTVIFSKTGLNKRGIPTTISDSVFSLSWVRNNQPGGFESVYFDRLTCRVSGMISGEQDTDGNRLAYSQVKDGVLTVVIRDLFDENGYHKEIELPDAYTKGEFTTLSTIVNNKHQAVVSYLTNEKGDHKITAIDLYEEDELKELTKKTEKTEKTKKTEKK